MISSVIRFFSIIVLGAFLVANTAEAAILSIQQEGDAGAGKHLVFSVTLQTSTESVNAVEGTLSIPEGIMVERIESADSAFSLWIQSPQYSPSERTISFSGGTPGGVAPESSVHLFTVHARADVVGTYALTFNDIHAYRNDGLGTEEPVDRVSAEIAVTETGGADQRVFAKAEVPLIADVGNDPALFDGQYFLFMYGGDNGSGVTGYAVKEGWWGTFTPSERYYILVDQTLSKGITVRANRADGSHVETYVSAPAPSFPLVPVLILVVVLGAIVWFVRRQKKL